MDRKRVVIALALVVVILAWLGILHFAATTILLIIALLALGGKRSHSGVAWSRCNCPTCIRKRVDFKFRYERENPGCTLD